MNHKEKVNRVIKLLEAWRDGYIIEQDVDHPYGVWSAYSSSSCPSITEENFHLWRVKPNEVKFEKTLEGEKITILRYPPDPAKQGGRAVMDSERENK